MSVLKSPWLKSALHVAIAIVTGILLVLFFFNMYLPSKTNHGETITVPDVIGIHLNDLDEYLTERNLRFEITEDSSYSADFNPLEVLKQFPLPNAKVKENRKVYLTLNTTKPPLVKMPDLIDGSIKNAQMVMKSYDLKIGSIEYVPDEIFNTVLKQKLDDREVLAGELIPKGSIIHIVSGDGLGIVSLQSPNLIELDAESAQIAIIGSGLGIGKVTYEVDGTYVIKSERNDGSIQSAVKTVSPGAVFKQTPPPGETVRLKELINIWVYRPDSINTRPTLLDE